MGVCCSEVDLCSCGSFSVRLRQQLFAKLIQMEVTVVNQAVCYSTGSKSGIHTVLQSSISAVVCSSKGHTESTMQFLSFFISLCAWQMGFFDTTKTGDISSRLTADCQKVSCTALHSTPAEEHHTTVTLFLMI